MDRTEYEYLVELFTDGDCDQLAGKLVELYPDRFEVVVLWGDCSGSPWWLHSLVRDKETGAWVDIEGLWPDVEGRLERFEERYDSSLKVLLPEETGLPQKDINQMKGLVRWKAREPYVTAAVMHMRNQGWI